MAQKGGGGARGDKAAMDNRSRQMNEQDSVGQSSRGIEEPTEQADPQPQAPAEPTPTKR